MPDATDAGARSAVATEEELLPTYGGYYYFFYESGAYERNEKWMTLFRHFAAHIVDDLAPTTVFDAGCAIGLLVETLRERGVDAWGRDLSSYAIDNADERIRDYVEQGSITDPLPDHHDRWDLITCIEVMEHLPADAAEEAIANLCSATDTILFSSAPDDFEEPSHINLRPAEEWSVSFARHGFVRDVAYDATWLSPWAVLYRRGPAGPADLIRAYDRALYRLRRENGALRATAVELENRLEAAFEETLPEYRAVIEEAHDTQATLARLQELHDDLQERHRALATERDGLLAQLDTARQELLGLRDVVIGQERELGSIRGVITDLEARLASYGDLPDRYRQVVESTTWRVAWKVFSPYRKVRERLAPPS